MITLHKMQKYAALAVHIGVNVQKGQLLILSSPVECAFFARLCMEEAYRAGACEVQMVWTDEQSERLRYEYENLETLTAIAPWRVEQKKNQIDRGCCFLYISADTPGLLGHIPGERLQAAGLARRTAFEPFQYYTMANHGQWSIVAVPTPNWALKVFPGHTAEQATDLLWDAILASVRIGENNDPVAEWKRHDQALEENAQRLNSYNFQSLHITNGLGTDLTVELVSGHIWSGGGSTTHSGTFFNPNLPTEEVFCMPYRLGVNGRVVSTKPLSYQGKLIEDFSLVFREGKVVEHTARAGEDALHNLLTVDEGSAYLGEVALVPHCSPISQSGVLFLETLFDENASCHLALGEAYPENLTGGLEMTKEELLSHGANQSKEHCDFMFGSADLHIEGIRQDGSQVPVFKHGNFSANTGFIQE